MDTSMGAPTINLKEALAERKNEELINYSKKGRYKLLAAWNDDDKSLVRKLIGSYESVLNRFSKWIASLDISSRMIFELGCLQGMVSGISHVLYCEKRQEEADVAYKGGLQYITHLSEIVKIIEKEGPLSHTDLSKKLQIKQSTLTEAMKKILIEDVVTSTTSGRYRVYSLTDKGLHYAKYLKSVDKKTELSSEDIWKRIEKRRGIKVKIEKYYDIGGENPNDFFDNQTHYNVARVPCYSMETNYKGLPIAIRAERLKPFGNMCDNGNERFKQEVFADEEIY